MGLLEAEEQVSMSTYCLKSTFFREKACAFVCFYGIK